MDPTNEVTVALQEAKRNDAVLQTLAQFSRNGTAERDAFVAKVVSLHNSGGIDLVAEFSRLRNDGKDPDFFLTRFVFEKALSTLHAPVAMWRAVSFTWLLKQSKTSPQALR